MINSVELDKTVVIEGDSILVTVDATDNVGVTSVTAEGVELTQQAGDIWNGTITTVLGTHFVNVSAKDAAGYVVWNNSTSYTVIETNTTDVTGDLNFTSTSGNATITGDFNSTLSGWINVTGIGDGGDLVASPDIINDSVLYAGLGARDVLVSGVYINVSPDSNIESELKAENGSILIELRYNDTEIAALGITDKNTIDIYKFNETLGDNGEWELVREQPYCNVSASGRNTTTNKVWVTVNHLCTFALVGSTPAIGDPGDTTSRGGGGGSGTYPPGWGEPASTPAATPAPTAAPEPTVSQTEAPTVAQTGAPTKAPTAATTETATAEMETKGTPGFGAALAVFAIAGLLVATYLVMRRRE